MIDRERAAHAASIMYERRLRAPGRHSPDRLPEHLTSFVGRERDIADIRQTLESACLVTLTGPGGIGKTRLAVEVALRECDAFPDGVWFVELAAISDRSLVPWAVASAFGLADLSEQPIVDVLATFLRERAVLLVLDNCEHLVAACAALVQELARRAPRMRIVATSRQSLGVDGEVVWQVSPLDLVPESSVVESPAVRLFVERAGRARRDFSTTTDDLTAIAAICKRLDGIPLAIELAAARVKELSVQQVSALLEDRYQLLSRGSRTAPARHRTLRALMDWGYGLLSPAEQAMLRRLAVFAGSCSLDAVNGICTGDWGDVDVGPGRSPVPVLDLLAELIDKSHVVATVHQGTMRYSMLDTVRAYALEKLDEAGETDTYRNRHRDWFVSWVARIGSQLWGVAACDLVESEIDNLRAAMDWSERRGEDAQSLQIGAALWRFWDIRGHAGEGVARFGRLVDRLGPALHGSLGARALFELGYLTFIQGDTDRGVACWSRALPLARAALDAPATANVLAMQAAHAQIGGDGPGADAQLAAALEEPWLANDVQAAAALLYMRGYLAVGRGELALAERMLEQGASVARIANDSYYLGHCSSTLGHVALLRDDLQLADARLHEALCVRRDLKSAISVAYTIEKLGWVAARRGLSERAARLLGAAEMLRDRAGAPLYVYESAGHERAVQEATRLLGEGDYATAWAAGRTMLPEQAIEFALAGDRERAFGVVVTAAEYDCRPGSLSAREREVIALIARHWTNRAIAAELVISTRTVEWHIGNVLAKLGLRTRADLIAWATERQASS